MSAPEALTAKPFPEGPVAPGEPTRPMSRDSQPGALGTDGPERSRDDPPAPQPELPPPRARRTRNSGTHIIPRRAIVMASSQVAARPPAPGPPEAVHPGPAPLFAVRVRSAWKIGCRIWGVGSFSSFFLTESGRPCISNAMGQEILYCLGCRNQLRSSDFEKRKAFKISGLEAVCSSCAPRSLRELPEEKAAALKAAMEAAPPTPSSTSKSGTARIPVSTSTPKSGTGRVPLAQPPPPARAPQEPDGGSLKMILIILAGAALATGMGLLLSSRPPTLEPSRTSDGSSPSAGAQAPSSASQPESAQDRIARESFRQATLYADAYPAEIEEQLRRF